MPTIGKIRSGYLAKSMGAAFERYIISSGNKDGIEVLRIPNGGETKRYRDQSGRLQQKIIRTRSPFDFCAFHIGRTIVFDAKTIDKGRFAFSSITPHQLVYLSRIGKHVEAAGYIVWYREEDQVIWHSHRQLQALRPRESLGIPDGLKLGRAMAFSLLQLMAPGLDS